MLSFVLVAVKVNIELPSELEPQSAVDRLRRIDFLGSLTLVGFIGCLLLGFSLKSTEEMPWSHPLIWGLFIASAFWGILFISVELHLAPYPVMPLHLITKRTPLAVALANLFCSMSAYATVRISPPYTLLITEWFHNLKLYNIPLVRFLLYQLATRWRLMSLFICQYFSAVKMTSSSTAGMFHFAS